MSKALSHASNINSYSEQYWTRTEIINAFMEDSEFSDNTIKAYRETLQDFFKWSPIKQPQNLNEYVLLKYKIHLRKERDFSATSTNAYLACLRSFCAFCFEYKILTYNPSIGLRNVKIQKKDIKQARNLSDEELKALFDQTSKDTPGDFSDRIYLLLIFSLGLRVSEAMNLKLRDFFLKGSDPRVTVNGKGGKQRELGITEDLQREIQEYIDCWRGKIGFDDYLIQSGYRKYGRINSKPSTRDYGSKCIKRYAKAAGLNLEGIRTHSGRVTAINILLDSEVSLRDVGNFAGHSSVSTTKRYDRSDNERVVETSRKVKINF